MKSTAKKQSAWEAGSKYFDPKSSPENPRWMMVDVAFVERWTQPVPLARLKEEHEALDGMRVIQKGQRLSVQPVDQIHYDRVVALGRAAG